MRWQGSVFLRLAKAVPSQLARRFWLLLTGIMVLAITASAVAIWFSATPFLRDFQNSAVLQKAEQRALSLEVILDQNRQALDFIATQRGVVSATLGNVDDVEILNKYTTDVALPDQLERMVLYDAFAQILATREPGEDYNKVFSETQAQELALAVLEGQLDAKDAILLHRNDLYVTMMIAAPVRHHGLIEGVVLGQLHLIMSEVFHTEDSIRSTAIIRSNLDAQQMHEDGVHSTQAVVTGTPFLISIEPDEKVIALAGRDLLINAVGAITFVLVIAFGAFAWLGRSSIIAPHLKLEEQKRELSELAAVARLANDAIVVTDLDEKILWCNPAFEKLSGYSIEEVRGLRSRDLLHGAEMRPADPARTLDINTPQDPEEKEILNYSKSGRPYWVSVSVAELTDEMGALYGYMAITRDITDERQQREKLIQSKNETEFQSLHDPLTGLANRRAFDAAVAARSACGVTDGTVIHIDLDYFKNVNDNMGHAAGDFVLREVARILAGEVCSTKSERLPDLAARIGGDEFVVLLSPSATIETAEKLCERLLTKIGKPIVFESASLQIGASFGIASTHSGLLKSDDLLAAADASLYDAKENGRNTIRNYTKALHHDVVERRELSREFKVAISNSDFEPYFQPQFDATTGEISGVEVLARWHSERRGLVTPDVFLPIAAQLAMTQELDKIMFWKASSQIMALHRKGIHIPKISFNVTAERLIGGAIYQGIRSLGENRPQIAIEVLESVIVEDQLDVFRFEIDRLRELGVWIEIDDFGTGHTSLVGIMELNPDVMKIDKRLIIPITTSEQARKMLKQIVGMANIIGVKITAEGVETPQHVEIAAQCGCDTLQGFGLGRPVPIGDLEALVSPQSRIESKFSFG